MVTLSGTTGTLTAWGAMLYLGARTVYLPLYILGIARLRSLIWTLGFVRPGSDLCRRTGIDRKGRHDPSIKTRPHP